jgi:hypothetical protein
MLCKWIKKLRLNRIKNIEFLNILFFKYWKGQESRN